MHNGFFAALALVFAAVPARTQDTERGATPLGLGRAGDYGIPVQFVGQCGG